MWAWRVMMTTLAVVLVGLLARGGTALPTASSSNDRPIIGILAQEVSGSLADILGKILSTEETVEVHGLDLENPSTVASPEYYLEPHPEATDEAKDTTAGNAGSQPEVSLGQSDSGTGGAVVPPTTPSPRPPVPKNATYIAASYVKFIEAGGARVVPVFVNKDREYYEHMMKSINGLLFPGGAVAIDETSAFGRAGKIIYEIAKDMNDRGDVFPLWGTCLGFELMMGLAAGGQEVRAVCDAQNIANRIKLDSDYADGYLLRHLPKRLIKALTSEPITSNFHKYCLTPKNFSAFGLDKIFRPLAYSADRRGVEYLAAVEAWDYPFFAVQFHPEKSPYEWTTKPGHDHIPHSSVAIDTANHFAQVYVNYARRNKHRFADTAEEQRSLIYNYSPVYTGQLSPMEQIYLF
ncbi:gamma-glutamyl hydrolase-like [Macrobrachium nipponense]|uniref:gamma-glutamyl hydrolase-like n=1 Tax=Macrobrachium nipponense TaxID=159736 RepID=UPI0030C7B2EC